MKTAILFALLFVFGSAFSQEDYTLHLKDTSIKVSLNKNYEMKINGQSVSFYLSGIDTLTYEDEFMSFKYTHEFKVSKSIIEDGFEQVMIVSADGMGVIIQKHAYMNPSKLNELMIDEVTKESRNYGFVMSREDYKRKLSSGRQIEINKAVLKYKEQISIYELTTFGKKDEGALILTMVNNNMPDSQGEKLVNLMWKTLHIK